MSKARKPSPSLSDLLWYFDYDKDAGVLIWKNHWWKGKLKVIKGRIAGRCNNHGYWVVTIKRSTYPAHRLIWFIENGTQPGEIDHIDGNKINNKIENLRNGDNGINQQNSISHRHGHMVGTTFHKRLNKWSAGLCGRVNGKKTRKHLGVFCTQQEAHEAYLKAKSERT